ncbi:MAG: hypothetical protein CMO55_03295 [Verrucomicrobiales bacterium]|nr:hypothetical protein [Verrucomicrobiales bacterium]
MKTISNSANAGAVLTENRGVSVTNNVSTGSGSSGDVSLVGEVKAWAGVALPSDFLWCNGASYSGAAGQSYYDLAASLGYAYGGGGNNTGFTLSWSSASSTIIASGAHALSVGDTVACSEFSAFGLSATTFSGLISAFVESVISSTEFTISETAGGTALASSSADSLVSGWHTRFLLPDLRDRQVIGRGDMGGAPAIRVTGEDTDLLGSEGGAQAHTDVPIHSHGYDDSLRSGTVSKASGGGSCPTSGTTTYNKTTDPTGISEVNHMDPFQVLNFIIRYR